MNDYVEKLTADSPDDAVVDLSLHRRKVDPSGESDAVVGYFAAKVSKKGKAYFSLGCDLTEGPGEGERVFGRFYPGKSFDDFLAVLEIELGEGEDLKKSDVIGARVRVKVESKVVEGVGGVDVVEYEVTNVMKA